MNFLYSFTEIGKDALFLPFKTVTLVYKGKKQITLEKKSTTLKKVM